MNIKLRNIYPFIFVAVLVFTLFSCVSSKRMTYFQEVKKEDLNQTYKTMTPIRVIQPHDEIYIRVSSFDDESVNPFESGASGGTVTDVSLISYTVNAEGVLDIPLLGSVKITGLTLLDAQKKLSDNLQNYLTRPTVTLRFVNKNVTVLGEVATPGTFTYSQEQLNVFQALGYANDITTFGNRENVFVIRNEGDKILKYSLNLNEETVFLSENYFLQDGDIVYVKPLKRRAYGFEEFPYALLLSVISTTVLTLTFFYTINNAN